MNARNLVSEQRGSIAIEFSLISFLLVMIMFYFADLIKMQAQVGKMERTVYSISGILRERTQIYKNVANTENRKFEVVQAADAEELLDLAKTMLSNMGFTDKILNETSLRVEQIHFYPWKFDEKSGQWIKDKIIDNGKSIEQVAGSDGDNNCQPPKNLTDDELSERIVPKSTFNRWVPVYQVVLCMPPDDLFNAYLRPSKKNVSYSIVMVR